MSVASQETLDDEIGHVQLMINALRDIIRTDPSFDGVGLFVIPRYDPDTFEVPYMHIFATNNKYNDLGFQNRYKYTLTIQVDLCIPQHEVQSDTRVIHNWEEQFQNVIIKNRQPKITGLRVKAIKIAEADYIDGPDNMTGVDSIRFIMEVEYDRVVNN